MTTMNVKTALTQKGEIDLRIIEFNAGDDPRVELKMLPNGHWTTELFTDSLELPEVTLLRQEGIAKVYLHTYKGAEYVLLASPLAMTLFIRSGCLPYIKTGNNEIDRVANSYKSYIAKKAYARQCSQVAETMEVPYAVALAFKGNKRDIGNFKDTLENAVSRGYYKSETTMELLSKASESKDSTSAEKVLMAMRIFIGDTKTPGRLALAVFERFKEERTKITTAV